MAGRLAGKVCVSTGTGGSMGRAAALTFAREGALVIGSDISVSVPVIGAGVALDLGASAPNTVLVFAILVGLGVAAAGWALLGHRGSQVHP